MNMKPYIYKGRFYNDENDAIIPRFRNMIRTTWRSTKLGLRGMKKKDVLFGPSQTTNKWTISASLAQRSDELVITWFGQSTFLIQVAGCNILTDPIFFGISRISSRLVHSPLTPEQLPSIDAVLISHNHRDHMDQKSLLFLKKYQPKMCVPIGNLQWFQSRGFTNVTEVVWWDGMMIPTPYGMIEASFLPASHWTGRSLFDINKSLWGSWMIEVGGKKIYFAGDTAYGKHFAAIRKEHLSIDVALMPIGPNEPRELLYDSHMSAEESVQAFLDLGAKHFVPMHWGTFLLCGDTFYLPVQRLQMHWGKSRELLKNRMLHIVKFGEQRKVR